MKPWVHKALELLRASLQPPKHELNELDWKAALSPDRKRLAEHLSAFANHPGGGFLEAKVGNLRRTRELLLPRLLSGQIDVSALTADALEAHI
jgi:hypothetical protein